MSRLVIGLTGGIGSGKTAVSDLFAMNGITIVDADVIAREVVEPGQPALKTIEDKFGSDILLEDGSLDRRQLRELVFSSPDLKTWLNELLHPAIRLAMIEQTQNAKSAYCILSVPLLVENGLNSMVNRILVVDVDEQIQLQRTCSRDDQSEEQVKNIMAAQASRSERLSAADDVIDNNGNKESLVGQVNKLHKFYLEHAKSTARA